MITITDRACEKAKQLLGQEENKNILGLRIYVKGGGCHGYAHGMTYAETIADDDIVVEKEGVKIILDPQSMALLDGSAIEYVDSLQSAGFEIKNPNAKTTCGCGSSFST